MRKRNIWFNIHTEKLSKRTSGKYLNCQFRNKTENFKKLTKHFTKNNFEINYYFITNVNGWFLSLIAYQLFVQFKVKLHHHHHHHHVTPSARLSLILSNHPSVSSIASGRSSELHPVSAQSCCINVRAGRPAFARPCEGAQKSRSLMSSSLLLQQCLACLARLILIVFEVGGWCPYSCCFVRCCLQDVFNIAHSILM